MCAHMAAMQSALFVHFCISGRYRTDASNTRQVRDKHRLPVGFHANYLSKSLFGAIESAAAVMPHVMIVDNMALVIYLVPL